MAHSKEIIQSLQTLVNQFVLNDAQIDEIPESKEGPMYWHYYQVKDGKPTGYGFSSPNFPDFISDVLFEIQLHIKE